MKRLSFVLATLLLTSAFAAGSPRPNLVIINIDDLGYGETSPFGGRNRTPELDRMAAEGRRLTSHYAAPVCTPSRASLMTGCYAKRVFAIPHVIYPIAELGLNSSETTIAEVLKDAGYRTAIIGKWHLGDQPEFLPTRHGFDSYFGLPYSNDMAPPDDGAKSDRGRQPKKAKAAAKAATQPGDGTGVRGAQLQPPLPLIENEKVVARVREKDQIELTRTYTERAVEFIKRPHDKPFFLYLSHMAVHFPRYPRDEFMGKSGNGLLGDWVQEVDWSVGQVLAALREKKLDSNTLVIFTSDNGGPTYQEAVNTPLRGAKGTTWEGGVRVCTIAWWPGKIPAGTSTGAITSMVDLLPTFAQLAGKPVSPKVRIDGVDIWPVLAGDPATPPRDHHFYFVGLKLEGVRQGPWKLRFQDGDKLYNLDADIGEANDVAAQNPEIVQRLRALAKPMNADLGWEGIGPGCRAPGRVKNAKPIIASDGTVRPDMAGPVARFP